MNNLSPAPFGRVVTAMVTPFGTDGEVDLPLTARLARHLVAQGSDALVVCGTTGESPTLSWAEQHAVLETVLQVDLDPFEQEFKPEPGGYRNPLAVSTESLGLKRCVLGLRCSARAHPFPCTAGGQ